MFCVKEKKGDVIMATRGSKPLKKIESITSPEKLNCLHCNKELNGNTFYESGSEIYKAVGKVPYCRTCLEELYKSYLKKYKSLDYLAPEKMAIERICMIVDIYYSDKVFENALKAIGFFHPPPNRTKLFGK